MKFKNQSELLKKSRIKAKLSQAELSKILGVKANVFVSNMERGVAGIPVNRIKEFSKALKVKKESLIEAILKDHESYIRKINK